MIHRDQESEYHPWRRAFLIAAIAVVAFVLGVGLGHMWGL